MDKRRVPEAVFAAVASVLIGIVAVTSGKSVILALGGILTSAVSVAIPAVPVVATMNAALYKRVEVVQSISIVDPTLMFALVSFFCLVIRMLLSRRNRRVMLQNRSVILWFAAFCIGISTGLLGPYSTQYGTDKLLRFVGLTGPLVLLASTWDRSDIEEYFGLLVFTSSIVALLEVLPIDIGSAYEDASAPSYLSRARWTGYGAILALMFWYRMTRSRLGRFISVSVWALCTYVLLTSGGRGPILAYVPSLVAVRIFGPVFDGKGLSHRRFEGVFASVIMLASVLYLVSWDPLATFAFTRTKFQFLMSPEKGASTLTRAAYFRAALRYFAESPIGGIGLGGFAQRQLQIPTREYPHNLVLEILSETGIVGFVPFIGLLAASLRGYRREIQSSDSRGRILLESALAVTMFALLNAMVSGDINDNRMVFVMLPVVHSLVTQQHSCCVT